MVLVSIPTILIFLLVFWGASWDSEAGEEWTEQPHRFVETDVRLAAAELGQSVNRMIDQRTRLAGVRSDRREVILDFAVNDSMVPMDFDRTRAAIEATARARVCTDPRMRMIVDRGGRFTWRYDFLSGHQFRYSVAACPPA